MSSTAVQYDGALRHNGCTLSALQHTEDYLTDCAPLWDALCSPAVSAREKKAVLSRLPDFDAMGELKHFYLLLADKNRFALLPEIVRQFRLLELRENGEGLCVFRSAREPEEQSLGALARLLCARHGYRANRMMNRFFRLPNCCAHDTVIVQLRLKSCRTTRCSAALLPKSTA